jgi:hypothetical protein
MKTLFLLVAIANFALFMWEYKTGAFVPVSETSEQNADSDQEQILLVSELKNVPQSITPAPVSEQSVAGNASTEEADKLASVPELLPAISESIYKPAFEKSIAGDTNVSELTDIPQAITSAPVSEPPTAGNVTTDEAGKSALAPKSFPAIPESMAKPDLEKSTAGDSNLAEADKSAGLCYEVGPFANNKAYRAWVSRLKDIKSEIKPINRDGQVPSHYMVYYPAAETELEFEANITMLKNHGIKDLWLLSGEDKGKISLGLFNKEESALVMKSELLTKGINAEIKTRYKTKSQKYALVKGGDKLIERLVDLKKTYPELPVKPITDATQGCW